MDDERAIGGTPLWVKAFGVAAFVVVVLLVVVQMTGAGGDHGPGRHLPPDRATQTLAGPDEQAPVSAPGEPARAEDATRIVEVAATDRLQFEPSNIEVAPGEIITFVVTNQGRAVHEFTLGDAAMQQEHAAIMEHMPHGMAHDMANSITLEPGETKQLTWQFGESGTLEYACHVAGHYQAGMRGQISVN